MAEAEAKLPPTSDRLRLRRHAQPHPLRDRQGLRRGRLQRHLRQAADVRPRPGRGAAEGRREDRRRLRASRTTTPATRSSGRPARWSSNGELGEINADPRLLHPGLAADAAGERATRSRPTWRTDPKQSGAAGCFGDIGTHAYNLGRYITGLHARADLAAMLKTFEPGRPLDDYGVAVDPLRERGAGHGDRVADHATAARTTCSSRSTAPRARWSGTRRSRTR